MTRTSWKRDAWALLASLLLTLPAAAESRRACEVRCKEDVKECQEICKKYAGPGLSKCTQACQDEERTCTAECKPK